MTQEPKLEHMLNDASATITSKAPLIIYILYLSSLVLGVTGLIGLVMAYLKKSEATALELSHYRYQIRTFWIGMLYCLIGMALSVVFIGFFILFAAGIWYIARCVKGMMAYNNGKPISNPTTWMI